MALGSALAAAALAAAGCGTSAKTRNDKAAIRQVVTEFAAAHDARACSLLTDDAIQSVYGGYTDPIPKARASCRAASKHFKGAPVTVTQINFTTSTIAKAGATNPAKTVGYTITLHRNGSHWRIGQITQARIRQ